MVRILAEVPPDASAAGLRLERRAGARVEDIETSTAGDERTRIIDAAIPCAEDDTYVLQNASLVGTTLPGFECSAPIRIRLHPRATMRVQLASPRGSEVPSAAVLRVEDCGTPPARLLASIPFPAGTRRAEISLPAGCVQPKILAEGFAPLALRSGVLTAGTTRDFGSQNLRPGAALLVRVVSSDDLQPVPGASVTLLTPDTVEAMARAAMEAEGLRADGKTGADGWVRLYGVAPGIVVLALRSPDGRVPQFSPPYEARAGAELVVDRVLLDTPASLHVTLDVPEDVRTAMTIDSIAVTSSGAAWPRTVALTTQLDERHEARFDELPPGRWSVRVSGRFGGARPTELAPSDVTVEPGSDAAVSIAIADRLYRGVITLGGNPRAGTFYLRPPKGSARRIATGESDIDGEFQVALETAGEYRIEFHTADGNIITPARMFEFTDPDEAVRLELPSETIAGRVVDENGQPVAGAFVEARQRNDPAAGPPVRVTARASSDGAFELQGVSPGAWQLHAERQSRRTPELQVQVTPQTNIHGVTLAFGADVEVTGRVIDHRGAPVPATHVQLVLPANGEGAQRLSSTTTRSGEFRMSVPAAVAQEPATFWFITPEQIVGSARRTLARPVDLHASGLTGEIRLQRNGSWRGDGVHGRFVADDGSFFPFLLGARTASSGRERDDMLVIARVMPGTWRYVEARTPAELVLLERGRVAALPALATLIVRPGEVAAAWIERR